MEYRYGINTCRFIVFYHKKLLFFVVGGFFCLLEVQGPLDVNFCSVYHIIYHIIYFRGLQIHMDMENGHINTKCTKQLQYMVHKLFDIIK